MIPRRSALLRFLLLPTACCLLPVAVSAQDPAPIQDNSFLIEEAYNQEAGVVQHINAFSRADGGTWAYAFTQEWPLGGITHQLSYSVPFVDAGAGAGIGDVAINYRHQLAGNPDARLLVAPRLTLLLPTGNETGGRGSGAIGVQANLPLSAVLSRALVAHGNLGATLVPSARGPLDARATATSINLGASAIWLARPWLNLVVEGIWLSEAAVLAEGTTEQQESAFINPGVRWAFNAGSVQVVPGVAYTVGVGPSSGDNGIFLYLSLEHAFRH